MDGLYNFTCVCPSIYVGWRCEGIWTKVAFDWEIRILQSNAKSENWFHLRKIRPQGGFQLRNPNPDFMDFLFTVRLGNPKNNLQNIFVNSGLLFANYACACKTAVRKDSLKILFRISQSNGKKEIQKKISQRWNPFSDFAFDCKSEIQILKSKSSFPNRSHSNSWGCSVRPR